MFKHPRPSFPQTSAEWRSTRTGDGSVGGDDGDSDTDDDGRTEGDGANEADGIAIDDEGDSPDDGAVSESDAAGILSDGNDGGGNDAEDGGCVSGMPRPRPERRPL